MQLPQEHLQISITEKKSSKAVSFVTKKFSWKRIILNPSKLKSKMPLFDTHSESTKSYFDAYNPDFSS